MQNKWNKLSGVLLLALVVTSLWLVGGARSDTGLILLTIAGVGSGSFVLTLLRPQRVGLSPPNVMLSLGFSGMLIGLCWDLTQTPIAVLGTLCLGSKELGLLDSIIFHNKLLPGMHLMMVAGGIAAIPTLRLLKPECRRLCAMLTQNLLCSTWMLVGMTVGAALFVQSVRSLNGMALDRMLGGMFSGMVWGMVISVGLYRLFFMLRDRLLRPDPKLTLRPGHPS